MSLLKHINRKTTDNDDSSKTYHVKKTHKHIEQRWIQKDLKIWCISKHNAKLVPPLHSVPFWHPFVHFTASYLNVLSPQYSSLHTRDRKTSKEMILIRPLNSIPERMVSRLFPYKIRDESNPCLCGLPWSQNVEKSPWDGLVREVDREKMSSPSQERQQFTWKMKIT